MRDLLRKPVARDAWKKNLPPRADAGDLSSSPLPIFRKASCACGGGCPSCQGAGVGLKVSHPNDAAEIGAGRIADRVMRMPEGRSVAAGKNITQVLQAKGGSGASVGSQLGSRLASSRGGGSSMDAGTRSFMESRFDTDFSGVRIHTGSEAVQMSRELNATAFTIGKDIYFNQGQYQPGSNSGKALLAHELTHTLQQGGRSLGIQRQAPPAPAPAAPAPAPAAPPHFRDCVRSVTDIDNADEILDRVLTLARQMVNDAVAVLENVPAAGTTYETALRLHFGRGASRATVQRVFRRITNALVVGNFICNRTACTTGRTQAMWAPSDDLIHICLPFWRMDDNCRAIIIIHEAAHDANIDLDDPATPGVEPHTQNRGEASYPIPGRRRTAPLVSAVRQNTPDAYAFFAAHIHNNADTPTDCFTPPVAAGGP